MTPVERRAAILVVQAIADCIREIREVPSGHLYARLLAMPGMSTLTSDQYQGLIGAMKNAGLVSEKNYLLTWIGPR